MKHNVLENWKRECYLLSSPLAINKQLERKDVDSIYKIFADYFSVDYFNVDTSKYDPDTKSIWLYYLLVNPNKPACIAALFETANMLNYLKTLSKSTQKKLKTLFADPRQFRDIFFEVYISRLLDYNKIENIKKPKENKKELDLSCIINDKEFLCECKKLYAPNFILLGTENYLMEKLSLKLQSLDKVFGLIGTIKFTNVNDSRTKTIFDNKLTKFFKDFKEQESNTIDYHDIDEHGEFSVINYSDANNIEVEENISNYHIIFKIIPPFNPISNHYRYSISANFDIPQYKVTNKLLSAIRVKNEQHVNSKYTNKIYFIDSETIPDFEFPIFHTNSMFEEEEIKEFINSFSENEIFCFIRREYINVVPKVSIKAFGRNIDEKVKQRLESLKTNFDYRISIDSY